jgi:hypothetical protein
MNRISVGRYVDERLLVCVCFSVDEGGKGQLVSAR